jgi:dTDP-4-dehydrorhamnose reductase
MKKVLITGSNGLLGQKLVELLVNNNGFQVIVCSKGENRLRIKSGYQYEDLDISNPDEVKKVFKKHLPDTVINTAAITNVDACENDKENCFAVNVLAVKSMLDAFEKINVENHNPKLNKHFIHLSTDFVFDGEAGPYSEEDKPNPLSYYGWSKLEAEKIIQQSSLSWSIIRTIIVYGVVNGMSRSNVVLWAKEALENGQQINVVDDQFRSPTLAEDLAKGCALVALKEATGIYHISGKETMSILELVYRVAEFFNLDKTLIKPIKSASLNQPAKRPPKTGFILDKARRELGYEPHSFEEGLEILSRQLK